MVKDYKKIYKKLIKEIKRMVEDEHNPNNYVHEDTEIIRLVEKRASQYATTVLNSVLEMNEEIEGKKCNMVIMNGIEFEKWKKKINVK